MKTGTGVCALCYVCPQLACIYVYVHRGVCVCTCERTVLVRSLTFFAHT
jgi:hypothetical protein